MISQYGAGEEIEAYLEAALEDGDPKLITHALRNIDRAKGIGQVTKDAGVSRAEEDPS